MRISILGGAGFIGQSLGVFLRKKKCNIKLIDSEERLSKINIFKKELKLIPVNYKSSKNIEFVLKNSDIIINLFSKTEPISSMKSFIFDAEQNIINNIKIFEAARNVGVKKIIFSSSGGAVYGDLSKTSLSENSVTEPISAYGVSKIASEKYLSLYKELDTISLRISNAYGPLQFTNSKVGIISKILKQLITSKKIIIYGDGKVIKDFIYIDDVCNAFYHACKKKNLRSGSYNVGSGKGISINSLIKIIFEITNIKTKVIYKNKNYFDVPNNVLNFSKFNKETNWKPKITIEKGINQMWKNIISR